MARPGDLLRAAFEHHQAGRYDSAEAGYKAVLKARPDAAEAIYLYGMLALQQGRHLDAVDRLQRARALLPGDARITAGLGQALLRLGRYREARPLFRTLADVAPTDLAARRGLAAVALETAEPAVAAETAREGLAHHPADPRLLNLFGLALHRAGDLPGAEDAFRSALSAKPEDGESWLNLAVLLKHADRNLDALDAAERAVKHMPGEVAAHANLGAILLALDEVEKAQDACRRARAMDAGNLDAVVNLAAALEQGGRYREAAAAAEDGLSRFPEHAGLHLNLGLARLGSGDTSGAEAALREADRRMPDRGAGQVALGVLFLRTGRPAAAEAAFRAALRHGAPSARLRTNLSIALLAQARHGEALQAARDALRIDPDDAPARSHLLTVLNYADVENEAPETAFEEARAWAARHEAPLRNAWPAHRNNPNPDRRLRVGYLSPDLRDHAVARFLQPVLEAHDAQAVMSICYADVARPDATSGKLREAAAAWRHVAGMNPARIARLIEEDEIDVLVDLAGHTWARNMLVLARRPAPVQASWIGYPATTGLGAVGLRLTDARADQAEAGRLYSESLVRLDPVFLCWKAPEQAPAPVRADGPPTFASFNNPAKISPAVIETWAVLLGEVPEARMLLKYAGLDEPDFAASLRERLAAAGVPADRLDLRGRDADPAAHLAAYSGIDVALDTFPYNGTTTTCEALWMGVPVVTLAGDRHAGRVGFSLLSTVGLERLAASDIPGYVETAAGLMRDREKLAGERSALRRRLADSPLCDGRRVAAEAERLFREAWRRWCAGI